MITKYTIKQINQNATLHGIEFVTASDCEQVLQKFVEAAVKAGADLDKMMKWIESPN
jgi:hypothetical protein